MAEKQQGPQTGGTIKVPTVRREKVREIPGTEKIDPITGELGPPDRVGTGEFVDIPDLSGLSPNQIKDYIQGSIARQQQSRAIGVPTAAERQRRKDFLDFPQPERQLPVFNNQPGKFLMVDEYGNPIQQQQQQPAVDTERRKFAFGVDPTGRRIQQQPDQISGMGQLRSQVAAVPGFLEYFGLTPDQINVMPEGTIANMLRRFLQDAGGPDVSGVSQLEQGGIGQPPMPSQMVIEQMLTGLGAQDPQLLQELGRTPVQMQPQAQPDKELNKVQTDINAGESLIESLDRNVSDASTNASQEVQNLANQELNNPQNTAITDSYITKTFEIPENIEVQTGVSITADKDLREWFDPAVLENFNLRARTGQLTDNDRANFALIRQYITAKYPVQTLDAKQVYIDQGKTEADAQTLVDRYGTTIEVFPGGTYIETLDDIEALADDFNRVSFAASVLGVTPESLFGTPNTIITNLLTNLATQQQAIPDIQEAQAEGAALGALLSGIYPTASPEELQTLSALPDNIVKVLLENALKVPEAPEVPEQPAIVDPQFANILESFLGLELGSLAGLPADQLGVFMQLLQLMPQQQQTQTQTPQVIPQIRMTGGG